MPRGSFTFLNVALGEKMNNTLPAEIQRVFEEIKNEIIDGVYSPGDPIPEPPLCKKYKINRQKMHKVINELEKVSLVERIPSKGAFVKAITARDIQEIYELKEAVEGMAARLAARRRPDDELNEMITLFEEAKNSLTNNDYEKKIQIANDLHHFILKSSGNIRIIKTIKALEFQIMRIWKTGINIPNRIDKAFIEHIDILMAIKDHNEELAEKLMKSTISGAFSDYITHILKQ